MFQIILTPIDNSNAPWIRPNFLKTNLERDSTKYVLEDFSKLK